MAHFLDPRSDIVFKRIFGEHPEILRDFLNSVLPFKDESEFISSLEYIAAEQVPEIPIIKNSIVDVRCKDANGQQFIVEMQMEWTKAFLYRVLFNTSKAYVRQLQKGENYEQLCPVWGLSILDATFDPHPTDYYHDYQIVKTGDPERVIKGLRLVFVELPKFRESQPQAARKLRWAWLKFLREAGNVGRAGYPSVEEFSEQVGLNDPLREAMRISQESAFTPAQLERYDKFWDAVSCERSLREGYYNRGKAEGIEKGLQQGIEKGLQQGLEKGLQQGIIQAALGMKQAGMTTELIAQVTGLSNESIEKI